MKHDPTKDNATGQGGEVDTANLSSSDSSSLSSRERRPLNVLATCGETSRHDLDRMAAYEDTPDGVMRLRRLHGFDLPMKKRPLRDLLSTRPGFKSGRQAGSFSLIKKYRCTWPFSFCFWIALLAVVLCWTGTEQTVIPLTGLVQRTHALGHAINRSGGPQSFVVTARVRRINPFP